MYIPIISCLLSFSKKKHNVQDTPPRAGAGTGAGAGPGAGAGAGNCGKCGKCGIAVFLLPGF